MKILLLGAVVLLFMAAGWWLTAQIVTQTG